MVRRSSAVEQLTVNQLVVGSIPTAGANKIKGLAEKLASFLLSKITWGHAGDTFFALNRANHLQYSPFTDQMRLIQYPRNDQRGIRHARTYSIDADVWFTGGG